MLARDMKCLCKVALNKFLFESIDIMSSGRNPVIKFGTITMDNRRGSGGFGDSLRWEGWGFPELVLVEAHFFNARRQLITVLLVHFDVYGVVRIFHKKIGNLVWERPSYTLDPAHAEWEHREHIREDRPIMLRYANFDRAGFILWGKNYEALTVLHFEDTLYGFVRFPESRAWSDLLDLYPSATLEDDRVLINSDADRIALRMRLQ